MFYRLTPAAKVVFNHISEISPNDVGQFPDAISVRSAEIRPYRSLKSLFVLNVYTIIVIILIDGRPGSISSDGRC